MSIRHKNEYLVTDSPKAEKKNFYLSHSSQEWRLQKTWKKSLAFKTYHENIPTEASKFEIQIFQESHSKLAFPNIFW